MTDLSVDVQGLRTVSSTMSGIRSRLDDTRGVIEAGRDDLGSSELYAALDSFESNWDDGRGQIKKNLQAMQEVLVECADAYDQVDTELQQQLREQAGGAG